ncbi:MAG: ACP S-malonyltransferase [Planctomycetota bacterium]
MSAAIERARVRAAVLCPGRGSYTEASLRSLPADHAYVRAAEQLRAEVGLEPLLALDRAERFEPARHLRPAHVSPLIYVRSMLDVVEARAAYDVVAIGGNSMGWYTALAAAGALSFEDGFRLVQGMSLLQEQHASGAAAGGQVIYPTVDDAWRADPERAAAVEAALASSNGAAFPSIRLGGYRVLAGSNAGISHLLKALPQVRVGKVTYPFKLAQHGPYHTHLAAPVADAARASLAGLQFRAPEVTLIDGRGRRHTPWSADVAALADYTFGAQVTTPYDFTASVLVALREYAPERLVLPGPGNTLGGVCGQVLAAEGWRGVHSKDDFTALQASDAPLVVSMDLR